MSKAPEARITKTKARRRTKVPELGKINIVGLFEAEAAALLQAVDRGLILHKTHNIRDSGALLESTFRQIIGRRLPPQAQMAHGYLYDLESICTPQVDAMVLSAADNYPMMTAEGEAIYAPFTSCRAYVEIKSSCGKVKEALDQAQKISTCIAEMAARLRKLHAGTTMPERVGSVLLYANSSDAKAAQFAQWFRANPNESTLVIFLDKAVVISRRPTTALDIFKGDGESQGAKTLNFAHPINKGEAWLYKPEAETVPEARGRVLLWLYYWLLYCATRPEVEQAQASREQAELQNSDVANTDVARAVQSSKHQLPPVAAFIAAANNRFPLLAVKKLTDFDGQIPGFESC